MSELERYWERIAALYEAGRFEAMKRRYGEDAVHTALVSIADRIRRNSTFAAVEATELSYIGRALHNAVLDRWKYRRVRRRRYGGRIHDDMPHPTMNTEREALALVTLSETGRVFGELSPSRRTCLAQSVAAYSYDEIAARTGRSVSGVRTRIYKARRTVREESHWTTR